MDKSLFLKPSALLPLAMSLAAFGTVVVHLSLYGTVREADEGAAAHLFQLMLLGQVPIIAFFAFRWLRPASRESFIVVGVQGIAVLVALAPVWFFHL